MTDESDDTAIDIVAKAGVAGMLQAAMASKSPTIPADLMVNAAIHVLAAWVASACANDPAKKRDELVDQIFCVLDEHIDFHAEEAWIPPPHDIERMQ